MKNITPKVFEIIPFSERIVLPEEAGQLMGESYGGWKAESDALTTNGIRLEANNERVLIGSATEPLTGIGVFIGSDLAGGYDFRAGDPGGNYIHWDASATTLTIVGAITATSGTIGGFDIGADYIRDVANSFGLASTVTGGDDVRFWAGDTFANRATAAFRVTESGAVAASGLTHSGGSVGAAVTVALGALNVAARGWTQTSVFSVTDADTVAWAAGTFTSADGTAYSIGGGNTGNMAAPTYVYLDVGVSTTAYQVTTTAATAVGAGKVLIAKAENGTGEATFQVFGGIGGTNINAASIVANSITANELSTSITYAGSIIIDTAGLIRSGQTAYNTGTGWWIGNDGGTPKFSIGNPAGYYLTWDGSTLVVKSTLPDRQLFTSNGTWTKPAGAKSVHVVCIGGGGGAGSGGVGNNSTACGGTGGGGGFRTQKIFDADDLSATVSVTVGAGGTGGAARVASAGNGNDGAAGGTSSFGTHVYAYGGGYGVAGSGNEVSSEASGGAGGGGGGVGENGGASTTTGGLPQITANAAGVGNAGGGGTVNAIGKTAEYGGASGGGISNVGVPSKGGKSQYGGGGGGAGGGVEVEAGQNGADGGGVGTYDNPTTPVGGGGGAGGAKGVSTSTAGAAGADGGTMICGAGGGGSGACENSGSPVAGAGGDGGLGGGGGGGGGAVAGSGGTSGKGGDGGDGLAYIISF